VKRLIVGDIQGCYGELLDLLQKAGLSPDDEIISVGDIVDRGPDSPAVLQFFRDTPNARSVMGNHERKNIRSFRREVLPALSQLITRRQFTEQHYPEAIAFMRTLPVFIDLPEAWIVHAAYEPGIPMDMQKENVLLGVMSGEEHLKQNYSRPWQDLYDGEKPLIAGHHDYSGKGEPVVFRDRVFCIDTGCCFGKRLTGLLLPEFRFISIAARTDHWSEMKRKHADLRYQAVPDELLSWEAMEEILHEKNEPVTTELRLRLQTAVTAGEEALDQILAYVTRKHANLMQNLLEDASYGSMPVEAQGRRYAMTLGETRLASLFHAARKGKLTRQSLRLRFRKPADAIELAKAIPQDG